MSGGFAMRKLTMRLLVFASHLFPNYKNPYAGSFVVEQVRHLKKFCDITVCVPHPWVPPLVDKFSARWRRYAQLPKEEVVAGVRVLHPRRLVIPKVNSWMWMTFSVTLCCWRALSSADFDMLEGQFVLPDGFAAVFLGRRWNKPSVIHVYGTDVHTIPYLSPLLKRLTVWALKEAKAIRTVSQDLARRCAELGVDPCKVRVIPNGVDIHRFTLIPRREAKERVGLNPERRHLLYVGRLVAVKGLDLLLEATALLVQQHRDVELVFVGDGAEREVLQRQVNKLGLNGRVHFVGVQPHDCIPVWMNAGDVLCLPSHREGLPTVLLEALACGTPVVATAVGGIPEVVADRQVGRLVHSRNPKEMAACIEEVLEAQWDRQRLRDYVEERFSFEVVTKELLEMYGSVMRNCSSSVNYEHARDEGRKKRNSGTEKR